MFESLGEQTGAEANSKDVQKERLKHWGLIAAVSIVLVGVLFLLVRFVS